MVKKRVLTPGNQRKKFPKTTGRIGKGLLGSVIDAAQEIGEAAVKAHAPKATHIVDAVNKVIDKAQRQDNKHTLSTEAAKATKPEATKTEATKPEATKPEATKPSAMEVKLPQKPKVITITVTEGHVQTDLGGFNVIDGMTIIKSVHKYLLAELMKVMNLDDGIQEGASDTTSGSDT